MLLVKTIKKLSKIQGIGLFAAEKIKKGSIIWQFHEGFDQKFSLKEVSLMPPQSRKQIESYGYVSPLSNKLIMCLDDARFMNHSEDPNTKEIIMKKLSDETTTIASRDIEIGEELTTDYSALQGNNKKYY